MSAIMGYDVQNSSSDRLTPITQKGSNITTLNLVGVLVYVTTRDCKQHGLQVNNNKQAIGRFVLLTVHTMKV